VSDQQRLLELLHAIAGSASAAEIGGLPLPETYRAAVTRRSDVERTLRISEVNRDPVSTLRIERVATPSVAPDEVLVAVMASSINFNTVWSSIFAPIPTFVFLDKLAKEGGWSARHGGDRHVLGSDASGVVVAAGSVVRRWSPGDHVVVHGNWVSGEDPGTYQDAMRAKSQRAWGFETNFGGLADLAVVKASQLMRKPLHLSWAESASSTLCNATAYRMLISPNGAGLRLGDSVLIWGATGGVGSFAVQLALAAGADPICVVSRPDRVALLRRLGVRHVIDRVAEGYQFLSADGTTVNTSEVARFGDRVREFTSDGVDVVLEHPGRETMQASIASCRPGGKVVTCAATTGALIHFDASLASRRSIQIVGSHFANYWENDRANLLLEQGIVQPTLTATYPLEEVPLATRLVSSGGHHGKIGINCLAEAGSGVSDPIARAAMGERVITRFARASLSGSKDFGGGQVDEVIS
jgi:crotonyl-CoA reductase